MKVALWFAITLLSLCVTACGGGGGGGGGSANNTPPPPPALTLSSRTPAAGGTDAPRTLTATLTFAATLDAATAGTGNVTLRSSAGIQPITVSVSGRDL